jgi:hypothetical protein
MHSAQQAIDVLDDAQAIQNAWNDKESAPASSSIISEDPTAAAHEFSSPSSRSSDVQDTELTEPSPPPPSPDSDEEEFGDFVSASTDPFKQPVYSFYPPDENETLELLNPTSDSGLFESSGLIEPVRASLDTSTRSLRRAGKLALRKLQIMREKKAMPSAMATDSSQTTTSNRPQDARMARQVTIFAFPRAPVVQDDEVENEYLPQAAPLIVKHALDGFMRPVSYAPPTPTNPQQLEDIDKMM